MAEALSLLDMLQAAPDLVELAWPPTRVCSGLKVCVCVRQALLRACKSKSTQLQVAMRLRSPHIGEGSSIRMEDQLAESFATFAHAGLRLTINPYPYTPVPVSTFSELYRTMRAGACSGPVSLDLSGCYWGVGDDPCQQGYLPGYPPSIDMQPTVEVRGQDEGEIFQALAYSHKLEQLIWANCMPTAEALDLRPLASSLGTSLTHLG